MDLTMSRKPHLRAFFFHCSLNLIRIAFIVRLCTCIGVMRAARRSLNKSAGYLDETRRSRHSR